MLLGISVPAPPPPPRRPTLVVCRHQRVILFDTQQIIRNIIFNSFSTHNLTLHKILHLFSSFKHNLSLTRSGKVAGMVSNLQHYPYVTITNKTPYDTLQGKFDFHDVLYNDVEYSTDFCKNDRYSVAAHQTWKASSRGACLVRIINAVLTLPDGNGLMCAEYLSTPATSYSIFSIIMKGDDECCVLSSHQTPQKCPDMSGTKFSPPFNIIKSQV